MRWKSCLEKRRKQESRLESPTERGDERSGWKIRRPKRLSDSCLPASSFIHASNHPNFDFCDKTANRSDGSYRHYGPEISISISNVILMDGPSGPRCCLTIQASSGSAPHLDLGSVLGSLHVNWNTPVPAVITEEPRKAHCQLVSVNQLVTLVTGSITLVSLGHRALEASVEPLDASGTEGLSPDQPASLGNALNCFFDSHRLLSSDGMETGCRDNMSIPRRSLFCRVGLLL